MNAELAKVREAIVTGKVTEEARELCEKHYTTEEINGAIETEKKKRAKLLELQELQKQNAELESRIAVYKRMEDLDIVAKIVGSEFSLSPEQLKLNSREQWIAQPRQVAFYLCRKLTTVSLTEIGRHFGKKDHGTVAHSLDRVRERVEAEVGFGERIDALKKRCASALKEAREYREKNGKEATPHD